MDPAALASFAKELGSSAAEIVAEIIETFLHDTPELIAGMRAAVAADDALVLDRAAHTLKSSSATVGAMRLSTHCRAVEEGARAGRAAVLSDAVDDVAAEFERVRMEFEAGIAA